MDPLSLLRDCVAGGKPWRIEGEEVVFGEGEGAHRVKKDEPTAWRKTGRKDAEDFYKLNDLALLAQIALADSAAAGAGEPLKHTQYLRKFGGLKVTGAALVAALDYMDVVKYLRGEVATADQIDRSRIISRVGAGATGAAAGAAALKRAGEEDVFEVDFRLGDLGRSTGLDAPALQELKNILEAKRRRVEEEATLGAAVGGEEEAWKADARMHRLLKTDEQLVSDRNGVLLAPAADFKLALEMVDAAQKKAKEAAAAASKQQPVGGRSSTGSSSSRRASDASRGGSSAAAALHAGSTTPRGPRTEPIIIVPSDPSAVINMTNVADFLENAHFVSPQERQGARGKREKRVLVTKKLDESSSEGPPLKFAVIDNPVWLQEHEWDSVVAVFSNGKAWQFSDWKYAQPVDLFHRCFGAFVHFDDEPVRGDVKGWNVRFYKVNKTKRHMDGIAASQFWMQLADWLKVHKPLYLLPVPSSSASGAAAGAGGAGGASAPR